MNARIRIVSSERHASQGSSETWAELHVPSGFQRPNRV